MVIWKELQHDDDDAHVERNVGCIAALRNCDLLKFFNTHRMVSHERLLEYILHMWNPEQQYFKVGAHVLTIEVEDIYFLIGSLRWGAPISLTGSHGGGMATQELVDRHCLPGTRTSRKKIPIKAIVDLPLHTLLFSMQRLARIQGPH